MTKADTTGVTGKTIHSWVWGILKKLHHMDVEGRATVLNRIICDYKKYALSPKGRKDPEHDKECGSDDGSAGETQDDGSAVETGASDATH